ncbi:MAG: AEC family transporter [Clostridia bacterium]|nr:AEC family transporter [Clostridia bacterium]
MKEIFAFSLNAVLPILLLMLLGYFLRRRGFFDDAFLKTANKLVFRVGLSVLLFSNVYAIDSLQDVAWGTVGYCVLMVLMLFFVGWVCAHCFVKDARRRGVLWQCTFRSNLAVIGMPLAQALGGAAGVAAVSVTNAFTIPLFNMLAVLALSAYVGDQKESRSARLRGIGKKVITNPLIIGIALGFVCLGIRALLPVGADGAPVFSLQYDLPFLYTAIRYLSQLATPLALVVLGGQFRFDVLGSMKREVLLGTFLRILAAPALGLGVAILLSKLSILTLGSGDYAALVALFGSPVAVSSAVMAGEMGNDDQLASQYVVWTSIGSMIAVFLTVVGLKGIGLL